jgi:hypothetical protein
MFNLGDEIRLFKKLGFNAVFYGEVLSGAQMPNLMFMTSFNNMAAHDQHWKVLEMILIETTFSNARYQHNVSFSIFCSIRHIFDL